MSLEWKTANIACLCVCSHRLYSVSPQRKKEAGRGSFNIEEGGDGVEDYENVSRCLNYVLYLDGARQQLLKGTVQLKNENGLIIYSLSYFFKLSFAQNKRW